MGHLAVVRCFRLGTARNSSATTRYNVALASADGYSPTVARRRYLDAVPKPSRDDEGAEAITDCVFRSSADRGIGIACANIAVASDDVFQPARDRAIVPEINVLRTTANGPTWAT